MHVLLLGMNYAPELTGVAPYTTGLAEHLRLAGHGVVVVAAVPHYPAWKIEPAYAGRPRFVEIRDGIPIWRVPIHLPRRGKVVSRIGYDLSFTGQSLIAGLGVSRPDVIIAVSPPVEIGFTAWLLALRHKSRIILLVKDLPVKAASSVGLIKNAWFYRLARAIERAAYKRADRIVVISEGFRRDLESLGVDAHLIEVLPDWADVEHIGHGRRQTNIRSELGATNDDFLILYSGNIGEKQNLPGLVRSIGLVRSERTRWAIVGEGSQKEAVGAALAQQRSDVTRLLPLQPHSRLPDMLASADALLLHQSPDVVDSVAPSKLLAYMAASAPIIAVVNRRSEAAHLVRSAACGLVVDPGDAAALARAVDALRGDKALRQRLGGSGRIYVDEHYSKATVLAGWDTLLREVGAADEANGPAQPTTE